MLQIQHELVKTPTDGKLAIKNLVEERILEIDSLQIPAVNGGFGFHVRRLDNLTMLPPISLGPRTVNQIEWNTVSIQ